jgi:hypothetical protein
MIFSAPGPTTTHVGFPTRSGSRVDDLRGKLDPDGLVKEFGEALSLDERRGRDVDLRSRDNADEVERFA